MSQKLRKQGLPPAWLLQTFPSASESFVYEEILALADALGREPRVYVLEVAPPGRAARHAFASALEPWIVQVPRGSTLRWLPRTSRLPGAETLGALGGQGLRDKDLRRARWLAAELANRDVAFLRCHFASDALRMAALCRRLGGPPLSVCLHARGLYAPPEWLRSALEEADDLQAISRTTADLFPSDVGPVRVLPLLLQLPSAADRSPVLNRTGARGASGPLVSGGSNRTAIMATGVH